MIKNQVLIIAEAGVNHNGSLETAKQLVDVASEAGADMVKFQTFSADRLVTISANKAEYQNQTTDDSESQHAMIQKFELSREMHEDIIAYCKQYNIEFFSTGFDTQSIDMLVDLGLGLFKIPSGEITNLPYLKHIGRMGKPIIMSTGLMNLDELEKSVLFIKNIWQKNHNKEELALLHCVSSYPTLLEDANLLAISELEQIADVVGYSDHTLGIEAAVTAVAVGARIIEKHFTIDNNYSDFHDHKLSANPKDFKEMVKRIRIAKKMLGSGKKQPTNKEKDNKKKIRRSIVAKHDLKSGHILTFDDLNWVRPGGGVRPGDEETIIGEKLTNGIKAGELIELNNLV